MQPTVFIPLADGFEEIEAITPLDIFCRADFDVVTAGLTSRTVIGSHGITFIADKLWDEIAGSTPDALVLPGGMPGSKSLGEHAGLKALAQRTAQSGKILAAICAAPAFTLAAWGLLKGRRATCFPGCETMFPAEVQFCDEQVVVDDRFITAKGSGAAADFAFALVEKFSGKKKADEIKVQMQFRQ